MTIFVLSAGSGAERLQAATTPVVASPHCLAGCPLGAAPGNRVLHRQTHVLSNNGRTKLADWVAYRVEPGAFGPARVRRWTADPDLPAEETLEPADYRDAHAILGVDRGHQAPLATVAGHRAWRASNHLSNVSPQKSDLNRGAWARLEAAVRRLARRSTGGTVYVMTGPLFERAMPELPGADEPHVVPSGYWKLIALRTETAIETAAFIMSQTLDRDADYCARDIRVSQAAFEKRTGLRFFPVLTRGDGAARSWRTEKLALRLGCAA